MLRAQQNVSALLASGIHDAKLFTYSYFEPASQGAMYSISNGWYHSANVKKPLRFDVKIVGNVSFVDKEHHKFRLNAVDYEHLRFADGSLSKEVSTAFGQNDPEIEVYVDYETLTGTEREYFNLPDGFGEMGTKLIPNAFIQASIGVFKGTEIKGRYFPSVKYDDLETSFYGGALQHEFTSWIPGSDLLPFAVSGIVAYTHLDASYDFTKTELIEGENQLIKANLNTWMFAAIVSTKLPIINFYGGLGYVKGTSNIDLKGTYHIQTGVIQNETVVDPFGIEHEIGGIKADLGMSLKFGFFRLNADYSFQKYQNVSVGIGFGI